MTTIRTIIGDSLREAGIIEVGDEPEAPIFEEALRRINTLYKSLFGNELGDPYTTYNYGTSGLTNVFAQFEDQSSNIDSTYVPQNTRLVLNNDSAVTLYLAPNPRDGARLAIIDNAGNLATYNVTLSGNGRLIESTASVVLSTNSLKREWFYRADLGSWTRVSDLLADDESPLPGEFDDFLVTLMALRLNPRHGATTSDEMIEVLKRIRTIFRARYRQVTEEDSELGLQRMPSNRRYWKP